VDAEPARVPPPGLAVTVQDEVGKPLKATLPVVNAHVGWVIVPTTGAPGVTGWALRVANVPEEIHPTEFFAVTV
jgi:hypothetical protein